MADTPKFVQSTPSANTVTDAYTAGAAGTVTNITVCNTGTAATTYRISCAAAGAADATSQYFVYDRVINPKETHEYSSPRTFANTDKFRVYVGAATVNFTIHVVEVS